MNVNYEKAAVSYAVSCWHDTCVGNRHVRGGPYAVNWELTSEVGGAYLLPCVLPDCFYHSEAFRLSEHLSQHLSVDVLVGIEADDQSISGGSPFL